MKRRNVTDTLIASLISMAIIFMFGFILSRFNLPLDQFTKHTLIIMVIVLTAMLRPLIVFIRNNKIGRKTIHTEHLKDDSRFLSIYSEIRQKHEPELKKIRRKLRPITIIAFSIGAVISSFFIWSIVARINITEYASFILSHAVVIKVVPAIIVILFFVAFFFYVSKLNDYERIYKNGLIAELVNKTNEGLVYSMNKYELKNKLIESYDTAAFDNHYYNEIDTEDYITGNLSHDLTVTMAELDLKHIIGSGKNRKHIKVFSGLFVHTCGIHNFGATIKILNNNNTLKEKNAQNLDAVKLDSTEFENMFNVYTDNKILTMRVLTSDIMQILVEFENRLGIHYELVIKNNEMYIRFFNKDLFSPAIFNESKEQFRVRAYYEIINLIKDISIELNKALSELEE